MTLRVGIVGASGFVGCSLIEAMESETDFEPIPFIHRSGAAARLARRNVSYRTIELLDRRAVCEAVQSADVVVNCSRGGKHVMLQGLENLLEACKKTRVKRFIHLSSVAIYGDPPHPKSHDESAPTTPAKESYGWLKLMQDEKVLHRRNRGLSPVILCPPNITGPYSDYLTGILGKIEKSQFALIDSGQYVVSLVDVRNLVSAVICAIRVAEPPSQRYFITDPDEMTWSGLYEELAPLVRGEPVIRQFAMEEFRALAAEGANDADFGSGGAIKHLASDEVRAALRLNRRWARLERVVRGLAASMGKTVEAKLQRAITGPVKISKTDLAPQVDLNVLRQQLRNVRHSSARAQRELGYQPVFSSRQSFADFRQWHREHCDNHSKYWRLLVNR